MPHEHPLKPRLVVVADIAVLHAGVTDVVLSADDGGNVSDADDTGLGPFTQRLAVSRSREAPSDLA